MIKRILILVLVMVWPVLAGGFVSLDLAGAMDTDSIRVHITCIDTTVYPEPTDPDTLYVLRFKPDGTLLDSVYWNPGGSSSNLWKIRTGWFAVHYKAADGSATLGDYDVYAAVKIGNDGGSPAAGIIRGHAASSYTVQARSVPDYFGLMNDGQYYWPTQNGCASLFFTRIVGSGADARLLTDSIQTRCNGTIEAVTKYHRTGPTTTAVDSISYEVKN